MSVMRAGVLHLLHCGLADRLEGVRNLVLTDRIAHWRGADVEGWLWRETMRLMPLIWTLGA